MLFPLRRIWNGTERSFRAGEFDGRPRASHIIMIIVYDTILYYTILYYTTLYYIILYDTILYDTILYYTM